MVCVQVKADALTRFGPRQGVEHREILRTRPGPEEHPFCVVIQNGEVVPPEALAIALEIVALVGLDVRRPANAAHAVATHDGLGKVLEHLALDPADTVEQATDREQLLDRNPELFDDARRAFARSDFETLFQSFVRGLRREPRQPEGQDQSRHADAKENDPRAIAYGPVPLQRCHFLARLYLFFWLCAK